MQVKAGHLASRGCAACFHNEAFCEALDMSLLNFNMLAVSLCCFLLIGGFAARQRRWSGICMLAGMAGLMGVILYNIRFLSVH